MGELLELFGFTKPLWEIAGRSAVVFLGLVFLLRVVPKRNAGHISPNDMLVLIVIGGIGGDAIMGGSHSLSDLLLMITLILVLGYGLDVLEYRVPIFRKLLRDKSTILIDDGRLLRRNMRREMVTEEELRSTLRKEGVEDLSLVKLATLEADGEISVIKNDKEHTHAGPSSQMQEI